MWPGKIIEMVDPAFITPINDNTQTQKPTTNENKTKQEPEIHCVYDKQVLQKIGFIDLGKRINKGPRKVPTYICPKCNTKYTYSTQFQDLYEIRILGDAYINISLKGDHERIKSGKKGAYQISRGTSCAVYTSLMSDCINCTESLIDKRISYNNKESYTARYCPHCKIFYLRYQEYIKCPEVWNVLNKDHLVACKKDYNQIQNELDKLELLSQTTLPTFSAKQIRKDQKQLAKSLNVDISGQAKKANPSKIIREQQRATERKKNDALKSLLETRKNKEDLENGSRSLDREHIKIKSNNIFSPASSSKTLTSKPEKIYQHDNFIHVKDFVVRRTTFKCMHHDHHLQNIDAKIDIIDKFGNVRHEVVSAGYCPNCNIFFIMESTYQKLKLKGTLVCRISDEKTYLNGTAPENGMCLAQESILMQYGYNVSQVEGLSSARRKKILAVLVDNDVLTKSEIISYLDFFINQRKHQNRFEKAIEKWESDKEFIEEYKNGSYKQYGVKGIFRKY